MLESRRQLIRDRLSFWGHDGWKFHNDTICQTYGFQRDDPSRPIRYVMGYGPADRVDSFLAGGQVQIVHWIGGDVMQALTSRKIPQEGVVSFADSWDLRAELLTLGIQAKVVHHRPRNRIEHPFPIPEEKKVAIYMPPTRHDFFRYSLMVELERAIADQWKVLWLDATEQELLGQVRDYKQAMRECTAYVRCPIHDGFSHTSAEFMMAGRTVITTSERPYQIRVRPEVDDIKAHLNDPPFTIGPDYYRWLTDPDRLFEAIWEAAESVLA